MLVALAFVVPATAAASDRNCQLGYPTLEASQPSVGSEQPILLRGQAGSERQATIQQRLGERWVRQSVAKGRNGNFRTTIVPESTEGQTYVLRARVRSTRQARMSSGCRWSYSPSVRVAKGAPYPELRGVSMPDYLKQPVAETDLDIAAAARLGSDVVRFGFGWNYLEQAPGEFAPDQVAAVDHLMTVARFYGMRVIATVGSTPCWALASRPTGQPCWPYPPSQPKDFRRFVDFFVSRWGGELAGLEVWSEPNFDRYFLGDPASYVSLVREAAIAVNGSAFADIPVVTGGLEFSDVEYLRQLYELGLARWTDAVAVHPYDIHAAFGDPTQPWPDDEAERSFVSGIPRLHDVMSAFGDRAPIWITEFGYASCPATPLCVDPGVQAQWLAEALQQASQWSYVQAMMIFRLRDTGVDDNWEGRFGLLGLDRTPKPAFYSVQDQFAALP